MDYVRFTHHFVRALERRLPSQPSRGETDPVLADRFDPGAEPGRQECARALAQALKLAAQAGVGPIGPLALTVAAETASALIDDTQERAIGQWVLNRRQNFYELSEDRRGLARVETLGERLAAHSTRPLDYSFHLLDSQEENAVSNFGGFIYVTAGMLAACPKEAQLAFVLGHELAHIENRDDVRRRGMEMLLGLLNNEPQNRNAVEELREDAIAAQRQWELDADRRGMELMRSQGYDPREALQTIAGWSEVTDGIHPAPSQRVAALEAHLAGATPSTTNAGR